MEFTLAGKLFLAITWGSVISLVVYCLWKVFCPVRRDNRSYHGDG